jgi:hypothetical protein
MKNKKTTLAGLASLLTGAAGVVHSISAGDFSNIQASIAAIIAGIGLLAAKDHNVTGGSIQQ